MEYGREFLRVLRLHSTHKEDPVPEWEVLWLQAHHCGEEQNYCICKKDIKWLFPIKNKITGKILEIGSDCVERWNIDTAMLCKKCSSPLSNRILRARNRDYHCPLCKRAAKRSRKFYEETYSWYGNLLHVITVGGTKLSYKKVANDETLITKYYNEDAFFRKYIDCLVVLGEMEVLDF